MDVVIYARYSSDKQTEQSIEGQNRVCTEFCEKQGYNVIGRYIDRATSAFKNTEKRTQFQKMIKDSERGRFQAVVVYKFDRFARSRQDSAIYKAKLKKYGVRVISATEEIPSGPEAAILESVLEGIAEFYSRELSQKVKRGMTESAMKCNSCGGQIPLGYKIENKKYVIDPVTAPIVKEAFDLYVAGSTVADIVELFDTKGYRTSSGRPFNKCSFVKMFKNKKYIGIYKYEDIEIEGGVPAIIDKDTFDVVQKKIVLNASAPGRKKAKVDYLLSTKIFCGHCGSPMTGECGTNAFGKKYYYYTCSCRKRYHSCDKKNMPKDEIERAVVEDVISLLTPERIDTLAEMAVKANRDEIASDTVIPSLEAEIIDVNSRISNLMKVIERNIDSPTVFERLDELEKHRKGLEARLKEAKSEYIVLEKEHVVFFLEKFVAGDIDDPDYRRSVVDLLLNSVTVWDEPDGYRITSVYNLTDNNTKTFRVNSSDIESLGAPKSNNPNIFFLMTVFGQTTKKPSR